METKYNYLTQKRVNFNNEGKIRSIKPLYSSDEDEYKIIHDQASQLKTLSEKFPQSKIHIEVNSVKTDLYKILKEDFDYRPGFQDGIKKFYYNPTVNSVLIINKEL